MHLHGTFRSLWRHDIHHISYLPAVLICDQSEAMMKLLVAGVTNYGLTQRMQLLGHSVPDEARLHKHLIRVEKLCAPV